MLTYSCRCGATLFFDSIGCVACGADCGWCDACRCVVSMEPIDGGGWHCDSKDCDKVVALCANRYQWQACNGLSTEPGDFCRSCRATTMAPDLDNEERITRWRQMEAAKRRLLYGLDDLGIPWDTSDPALTFRFPADTPKTHYNTGHHEGVVTINLDEADAVEREIAKQEFAEPQRTVIGHLRHEASHYLWRLLVQDKREDECRQVFGDHTDPPYADAMPKYYEHGAPGDWQERYISRYASSHPWEDFAETAAFYLDMRSVLETVSHHFGYRMPGSAERDSHAMLTAYQQLGVGLNEVNRALGLTDALPEVVSPTVAKKIEWVHHLLSNR